MRRKHPPLDAAGLQWAAASIAGDMAFTEPQQATSLPTDGCANCRWVSRYGNCGDPVAAGLSHGFELVAHPHAGRDCAAHQPVEPDHGVSHWRVMLPDGIIELACCPPQPARAMHRAYPQALRIELIDPADAWNE